MLKLHKDNALTRQQLAKKAIKKIPLYEKKGDRSVKVPFLDMPTNKIRYLIFSNLSGYTGNAEWSFIEVVD
ncbi:MAG TPA: hypothetical protein VKI61_02590 [Chitinophagaceae bacterium]|jgi:hypothetical protein|nr:hypothetical protein [Chitinophagaceae bacterium]